MRKKNFYALAGMLIAAFLVYRYAPASPVGTSRRAAATAVVYDRSVTTEYGKPITVARVIDGDTIELVNGDRLRYIGVDTPEEVDPRKPVQCFAAEAAAENKTLVEGKSITFYNDVTRKDKYGRWLGFVYLSDGTFINQTLVRQGFAFAYPYKPDISRADVFANAEGVARAAKLGIWSACAVHNDASGREQTNTL